MWMSVDIWVSGCIYLCVCLRMCVCAYVSVCVIGRLIGCVFVIGCRQERVYLRACACWRDAGRFARFHVCFIAGIFKRANVCGRVRAPVLFLGLVGTTMPPGTQYKWTESHWWKRNVLVLSLRCTCGNIDHRSHNPIDCHHPAPGNCVQTPRKTSCVNPHSAVHCTWFQPRRYHRTRSNPARCIWQLCLDGNADEWFGSFVDVRIIKKIYTCCYKSR